MMDFDADKLKWSSYRSTFTDMELGEYEWLPHDGQAPDKE